MGRVQQKSGDDAEVRVRKILRDNGIPNFKLKTGVNGTVFDVIAVYHNVAYAFEVKSVKKGVFYWDNAQFRKKEDEISAYARCNSNTYLVIVYEETGFVGCIHIEEALLWLNTRGHINPTACYDFNLLIGLIRWKDENTGK